MACLTLPWGIQVLTSYGDRCFWGGRSMGRRRRKRSKSSSSNSSSSDDREKRRAKRRKLREARLRERESWGGALQQQAAVGFGDAPAAAGADAPFAGGPEPAPLGSEAGDAGRHPEYAVRPECRVYVGNIAWEASKHDLVREFSRFGKVMNCTLNSNPGMHKGYCFVDFTEEDGAKAALAAPPGLISFRGRVPKIGPPSDTNMPQKFYRADAFDEQTTRISQLQMQQSAYLSRVAQMPQAEQHDGSAVPTTVVQDRSFHEALPFVSGMSARSELSRRMAAEGGAFPVTPRGDPASAEPPAAQKPKTSKKIVSYDNPLMAAAAPGPAGDAKVSDAPPGKDKQGEQSNVVCLSNLVARVEDADEQLARDVKQECLKFGNVTNILIYDEQQLDGSVQVKLFVQFATREAAAKTVRIMHGRRFDSRKIEATLYPEAQFAVILQQ
eukprot:TRINITY_DN14040_c0_g1_i1.p1 TRINITY_DN14040_c0_g1~~TRINITY_DN14040_c0_g1_i1.p1  ORF type:complete len:440 (+),score=83.06 TRINITY_DN14040_c0_g1_i1:98-1417(+)